MTAGGDQDPARTALSAVTIDLAMRLGFIALLGYWSFRVIAPFLTIGLWSAILAVALYPLFDWLAGRLSPRAAAALVTLLSLMVVVGPVTWLGLWHDRRCQLAGGGTRHRTTAHSLAL